MDPAPLHAATVPLPESAPLSARWPVLRRADPTPLVLAVVAPITAALVVADVCILLFGVIARYWADAPQTWTDDAASTVFLWLAMLGAVVALCRGEHMRMSALVPLLPLAWRGRVTALADGIAVTFLGATLIPAVEYWEGQVAIINPVMGISDAWRTTAIPLGLMLMFMVAVANLLRRATAADLLWAAGSMAMAGGLLYWAAPALEDLGNLNLGVYFVGLVGIGVLSGAPIAFAFGLSTLAYITSVTDVPASILLNRMDVGMSNLLLLAIPLFIYLGLLIEVTGMARAMVAFLASLLGHVRGGLHYVLLVAMYLVSGISGSKAADMAAIAPVLLPEMKRRGERPGELIGLLTASGAMAETIPPSLVLITIGSATGVSIAGLFAGGLMPALVAALVLAGFVAYRLRRVDCVVMPRATLRAIGRAGLVAGPTLLLPFLIRYAVLQGIATATEVSTMGVAYALLLGGLTWRQVEWRRMYPILVETATLSGAVLIMIGTATAMAWALTQSGFSHELVAAMRGVPGGAYGFLAISICVFIVLGSVLEGIPAIVVFGPLLFPAARLLGINEVHYAMVAVLAMGIGLFAPPFGIGFYTACAVGRVNPDIAMRPTLPYLGAVAAALILVALFPSITTWLLP